MALEMKEYETITILRPDLLDEGVERIKGRFAQVVEKMEGRLLRFDNWGKRKLAYEVKKQTKGIYLYFLYLGNSGIVSEVERNLRMWDDIIRYLTVKVNEDVDPDARPTEIPEEEMDRAVQAASRPYSPEETQRRAEAAGDEEEGDGEEGSGRAKGDDEDEDDWDEDEEG
ncbi:MAG: 30S ribosomal protein S6 [Deltaproteobacteria bacterium]|nr:30S ribosomal protein S6 [Deltaproteobacteria bacterium]